MLDILRNEHKKLEVGGTKWLREYGCSSRGDIGFTFYLICRELVPTSETPTLSTNLQKQIKAYMESNHISFAKKWNPVDRFTSEWTKIGDYGRGESLAHTNSKTHFDPGYAAIINRNKEQSPQRLWLADQYAADVRRFFNQEVNERSLSHYEVPPMVDDSPLTALGRLLFWDPPEKIDEVVKLLKDKKQLIFYGPPGTGKTYVARALAKHLMGDEEPVFLQFHPSYSYEDFFEGYRPLRSENGGMPQFALEPGPLKQLAQTAKENSEKTYVLVIDEINRGNLAKVFGELYFLLEYRNEDITLQYGGAFRLPENLLIVGTMNTADRSISHIDAALRRRFYFFPLFPDKAPVLGLLRRYLTQKLPALEWVADVVDRANEKLPCRDAAIGYSHFMRKYLDEGWVYLIWDHSIMPLIEEWFIDQKEKWKEFELGTLRKGAELRKPGQLEDA